MRVFYLMLRIPLLRYFTPNVRQTAFRRRQSRRRPQMQLIREGKQRGLCSNWFVNKDHLHIAVDVTRVYWAPLSIAVMQKLRAKSCAQRCERRFLRAFPCLRAARNGFDWGHKDFREDYTQVDVTPLKKSLLRSRCVEREKKINLTRTASLCKYRYWDSEHRCRKTVFFCHMPMCCHVFDPMLGFLFLCPSSRFMVIMVSFRKHARNRVQRRKRGGF